MLHASTQRPAASALPLRPLWYAKDVRHPFPGVTRVVVPLAGGPPPPDAEARLTATLERMWVTPPAGLPYANAIAVSIDREPRAMEGRAYWLVLVVSSTGNCASLHIDRMARHLRTALTQLAVASGTPPKAPGTPDKPLASVDTEHVRELLKGQVMPSSVVPGATARTFRQARLERAQHAIRAARSHARGAMRPSDPI